MEKILILLFITSISCFGQDKEEVIDYTSIRSILKKDGLIKHKKNKETGQREVVKIKKKLTENRSKIPGDDAFWSFFSQYWLVKNASTLRWDFNKPDYGIASHFQKLLEKIGLVNRKLHILVVNTPEISHMGLPSNTGEYVFILSLPFMKALDLSKQDISLLLLEDMLRVDEKIFRKHLTVKYRQFLGKQFPNDYKKVYDFNQELLKDYSNIIFNNGFTFSDQYKVTKIMDRYLKPDAQLWSSYIKLLNKINKLVKTNNLYKKYTKIFPSPQLQLKWLSPKKKVL
ncbi:MAG: hypothetical protein N4A33_02600 [Bacteriovoracaceae bacterium]|jgi:hypothetical protein|nr:hypothetical protein [Bacteriovoracaceae bacterium]